MTFHRWPICPGGRQDIFCRGRPGQGSGRIFFVAAEPVRNPAGFIFPAKILISLRQKSCQIIFPIGRIFSGKSWMTFPGQILPGGFFWKSFSGGILLGNSPGKIFQENFPGIFLRSTKIPCAPRLIPMPFQFLSTQDRLKINACWEKQLVSATRRQPSGVE